jgi:hypothetical protein
VAIHKSLHGKSPALLPAISDSIEKIVARKKKKYEFRDSSEHFKNGI